MTKLPITAPPLTICWKSRERLEGSTAGNPLDLELASLYDFD